MKNNNPGAFFDLYNSLSILNNTNVKPWQKLTTVWSLQYIGITPEFENITVLIQDCRSLKYVKCRI